MRSRGSSWSLLVVASWLGFSGRKYPDNDHLTHHMVSITQWCVYANAEAVLTWASSEAGYAMYYLELWLASPYSKIHHYYPAVGQFMCINQSQCLSNEVKETELVSELEHGT